MTDTCVCGGSRARPNPDCERCELIAENARLRENFEACEAEIDRCHACMTKLELYLALIRDGCSEVDTITAGGRACHIIADLALGGGGTTKAQQEWAMEYAKKHLPDEPEPPHPAAGPGEK